jgi:hypothetical protein
MKTRCKLKPGQKGTKGLLEKYGDALVCVRYRYDDASRTRLKTVELIVERKELPPPNREKAADNTPVAVKFPSGEPELRKSAKRLGGRWDPVEKLWYIPKRAIKGTELEMHIILDAKKKTGKK